MVKACVGKFSVFPVCNLQWRCAVKLAVILDMHISVTPDFLTEIFHLRMKILGHLAFVTILCS